MIFDHIGIFVHSIPLGRKFFEKTLAIKKKSKIIKDDNLRVKIQFLYDNRNICYELISGLGKNNPVDNTLNKNVHIINHIAYRTSKFEKVIKTQKTKETFSNLASLLQSFEIGKDQGDDLVFFLEDDYLHFESMLEEMIASYERIASQLERDIFMCPSDYPYLYMNNEKTNVLIGNKRHWRTINKTLCTFMTSKKLINNHWEKFYKTCLDRNDPFEKYLNEIYHEEICLSPLTSLSLHLTNINSSYGLAPFIDYKKIWDQNK